MSLQTNHMPGTTEIWVYIEEQQGQIIDVSLELLTRAVGLADETGGRVSALALTSDETDVNLLSSYGAERVITVIHPAFNRYAPLAYTGACVAAIQQFQPDILLMGATSVGRDLAPRLAARLRTGLTADCTELGIDPDTGLLLQTRPAFGGSMLATIVTERSVPQIATFRPGVLCKEMRLPMQPAEVIKQLLSAIPEPEYQILATTPLNREDLPADQRIIVGAGRGADNATGIELVRQFAESIDATFVVSRSLVDQGLVEQKHQVGQTGRSIAPDLYIACGISGAVQHLAGIKHAKKIMAINTDPDAPLSRLADYYVQADIFDVLPMLIHD